MMRREVPDIIQRPRVLHIVSETLSGRVGWGVDKVSSFCCVSRSAATLMFFMKRMFPGLVSTMTFIIAVTKPTCRESHLKATFDQCVLRTRSWPIAKTILLTMSQDQQQPLDVSLELWNVHP